MSIIWCGGEIEDFETISANVENYGVARTGFSRTEFGVSVVGGSYLHHALGSNYSDLWVTFRAYKSTAWISTYRFFGLTDGGVTDAYNKIALVGGTSGYIRLVKYNGTTQTELASGSFAAAVSEKFKIDIQLIDLDTSNCTINVYIDNILYLTYTGDLSAICSHVDGIWFGISDDGNYLGCPDYSEVIVATESTLRLALVTLAPSSAGDTNTWDAGAYTDVDEITENQTDVIASGTADQVFLANCTNTPAGTYSVRAVKIAARAAKGATGPANIKIGLKTNGTEYWDDAQALAENFVRYENLWEDNPDTSLPFTTALVDSLQIGVKSIT